MKKILAISLIAMSAVTAANAEIASKAYVDTTREAVVNKTTKTSGFVEADYNTTNYPSMATAKAIAEAVSGGANYVEKNNDITAGTATKITYDAKGLVTGGADLQASDIPDLTLSKITDSGALAAKDKVEAGDIDAGAIVNADISATAAISDSKIAATGAVASGNTGLVTGGTVHSYVGAIPAGATATTVTGYVDEAVEAAIAAEDLGALAKKDQVAAGDIEAGAIVNADISSTAAIADSKIAATGAVASGNTGLVTGGTVHTALQDYTPTTGLANVATSGDYGDLSNTPTIGAGVLTVQMNGASAGTFSANATDAATINLGNVITAPSVDCTNKGAKCVLTVGNDGYAWEVVQRGTGE